MLYSSVYTGNSFCTAMNRYANPANRPAVRVGISGWRYSGWRGRFYPPGLPQKEELRYAASRFNSLEINGSFYSLQRPADYAAWRGQVPDDFLFSVKGPRYITHMLRLRDARTALANFFASGVLALDEKLGPILWQLPATFAYDHERLLDFFRLLPRTGADASRLARKHDDKIKARAHLRTDPGKTLRHAIEVRHPGFMQGEFIELLRRQHIALVVADTAGKWPHMEDVTADFVYVRLHGEVKLYESRYTPASLKRWADKVEAWRRGNQVPGARTISDKRPARRTGREVFVYFDNDAKVHAPGDAARLARKLGLPARP